MKISSLFIFIVILLILLTTSTKQYSCRKYLYSYMLLKLSWLQQYCFHHTKCKVNWREMINQKKTSKWIIQGYWPGSTDVDFMNCVRFWGGDPNCNVQYGYNESLLQTSTRVELNTYWPQITTSNQMKQQQWHQHGRCYLSIMETMNPSLINKQHEVFQSYYQSAIKKAKELNLLMDWANIQSNRIKKVNKTNNNDIDKILSYNTNNMNMNIRPQLMQIESKQQLAIQLNIKVQNFHALCEYDPMYLSSIAVCYQLDNKQILLNTKGSNNNSHSHNHNHNHKISHFITTNNQTNDNNHYHNQQSLISCPTQLPNQCEFPIKVKVNFQKYQIVMLCVMMILFNVIYY